MKNIVTQDPPHCHFLPAKHRRRLDLEMSPPTLARMHDLLRAVHQAVHVGDPVLAAHFAGLAARSVEGGTRVKNLETNQ